MHPNPTRPQQPRFGALVEDLTYKSRYRVYYSEQVGGSKHPARVLQSLELWRRVLGVWAPNPRPRPRITTPHTCTYAHCAAWVRMHLASILTSPYDAHTHCAPQTDDSEPQKLIMSTADVCKVRACVGVLPSAAATCGRCRCCPRLPCCSCLGKTLQLLATPSRQCPKQATANHAAASSLSILDPPALSPHTSH